LLADPYIADPVRAAVDNCDVWIDMSFPYMAGSTPWDKAMHNGRTRYLLAADLDTDALIRLYGRVDLERLFELTAEFDDLLRQSVGEECHITNDAGTDVRFSLDAPMAMTCGGADHPGPFFVPGTVVIIPKEDTVTGVLKFDSVFHEYYTKLAEPITVEVDGLIQRVYGGGSESTVLERALRRASGGDDLGHIIHFTSGFHPSARFTGDVFVEDQRTPGFCAVGMGRPFWVEGGGENHPDAVSSLTSFSINDEPVVEHGRIVGPTQLANLATGLVAA
jgi:leucyl aminopeptidase (aminopeptidase T)